MSTPQDILSQILQGGLLDYSQPQVNSGLLGGNPNMNLGLSLLANSNTPGTFGALLGKSALETQQRQQNNAASQMQLLGSAQDLRMNMMQQQAMQEYMKRIAGGQQPSQDPAQQQPQQNPQQFMPGISQMPLQQTAGMPQLGQPQAQLQTSQQPTMFGASSDIASTPINGMSPDMYRLYNAAMKKDPLETEKALRAAQVAAAQDQVRPQLDAADTLINSDKPAQYAQADPQIMSVWRQTAPRLGMNPLADFNDQNVRTAIAFARNEAASRVNLPVVKPTVPMQTTNGPLGSIWQTDPLTGKRTQVKGEEELKQVVDPKTGQPILVPASKAAGMQPFNASLYGAANVSDQALQFAADTYRTTGKFPAAFGRNPAMQAKVLDKVAADAAASGDTAGSIAARQAGLKANGQALDLTTKKEAVIKPATEKLDMDLKNLLSVAKKVDSTGSPIINRAVRAWQQGVKGDGDVAQMVTWLNAVEGEYAKINSGGTGAAAPSVAVRKEAHDVINKYFSEGTMESVAQAMRQDGQNALIALQGEKERLQGAIGQNAPGNSKPLTNPGQSTSIGGFTVTRVK